jgi:nucleoside-diphosphate-sugar epimerase
MRVVITGAGLIGTHTAKELIERGDEVTFFDFAPQTGLYPSCDRW